MDGRDFEVLYYSKNLNWGFIGLGVIGLPASRSWIIVFVMSDVNDISFLDYGFRDGKLTYGMVRLRRGQLLEPICEGRLLKSITLHCVSRALRDTRNE